MSFRLARLGRRGLDEDDVREFCARVETELVQLLEERAALFAELRRLRGHPPGSTPARSRRATPHGALPAPRDTPPPRALGAPVGQSLSAPVSANGWPHTIGGVPGPHRPAPRWPDVRRAGASRRRGAGRMAQRDGRGPYGQTGLFREHGDPPDETGAPYAVAGAAAGPYGDLQDDDQYGNVRDPNTGGPYRAADPGGPVPPPRTPAPGSPVQAVSILAKAQQTAERCMADAQAYSREVAHDAQRRREQILAEASARAALMLEQAHRAATRAALNPPSAPASDPAREDRFPY